MGRTKEEAPKTKGASAYEDKEKMDITNPTEKTAEKASKFAKAVSTQKVDTSNSSAPGGKDQKFKAQCGERTLPPSQRRGGRIQPPDTDALDADN